MLVPMSKQRFVARMIADAEKKAERDREAKQVMNQYVSESITRRVHRYHRRCPNKSISK